MTEGSEPRVVLGPEIDGSFEGRFAFDYATDTGDALIEHIESGAEVRWNGSEWVFNRDIDAPTATLDDASVVNAPTNATDVTRKEDLDDHNTQHENGGGDEISVEGLSGDLADAQDPKNHSPDHGFGAGDELATALRYQPESEPTTPTSGCVRWYDSTDEAFKAKFDDGSVITLGER